jgi:hypothetical protein
MITQPAISGEPSWRQVMELEARKEVIERWLSESVVPSQLVEVLQEMLATTERQLQVIKSQAPGNTSSSPRHGSRKL